MLDLDDNRWNELKGGYRAPFDPRPFLAKFEAGKVADEDWYEFWGELYHQGDVGEASYATVPHLVRIYRQQAQINYNTYGLVATIELARAKGNNPDVPDWQKQSYFAAIEELAHLGITEIERANDPEDIRAILSILAIWKGARTYGRFAIECSEDELLELEDAFQSAPDEQPPSVT
jgi:hypothetical protein